METAKIVEAITDFDRNRKEVHDLIGQLLALNEEEIRVYGIHREQRQQRATAMLESQQREADERVDICVKRKDLFGAIMHKLNGVHPGPITIEGEAQNQIFLEERPRPRRKPWWRRWLI